MNFDWHNLAFGSKKQVDELHATFIAAPRDISTARFTQLVKKYLPKGNVLLGLAKEPYIDGFEGQPQFTTLHVGAVQKIIDKVNAASKTHKIYTLTYFQRELPFILEKLDLNKVALVNGSWKHMFHTSPAYYVLAQRRTDYDMISPFANENEARGYEATVLPALESPKGDFTEKEMLEFAGEIAKRSFDYSFQTGVALGRRHNEKFTFLAQGFNKVVPYQAYAMYHGASREVNFSPPNDLNHYDTVHAEVNFMVTAQKQKLDLTGTTLFINLLPCPSCARMFTETDIAEFVYANDHSEGYALRMLEAAGKKVRRLAEEV
jgi:deoxycytidylate deaminase